MITKFFKPGCLFMLLKMKYFRRYIARMIGALCNLRLPSAKGQKSNRPLLTTATHVIRALLANE